MSATEPGIAALEMALEVAKRRVAGGKTEYRREMRSLENTIAEIKQRQQRESSSERA